MSGEVGDPVKDQAEASKVLDDALRRYGFSPEELGPKFAAAKLDEMAAKLLADYELLTRVGGLDHSEVLKKMAPVIATMPPRLRHPKGWRRHVRRVRAAGA